MANVEPFRRADGTTYYRARIRLADDSRVRVDVPQKYATPAGGKTARERAELYAAAAQEREDETGALLAERLAKIATKRASGGESCDTYFGRVAEQRAAEGKRDVQHERDLWNKWISPLIGAEPVATISRDDIEAVRNALDTQVRLRIAKGRPHGLAGKSAMNIWSILRIIFKETVASRDKTKRVRTDDPSHLMKAPLQTRPRTKTFLYPIEVARLLLCALVPLEWRELYAIASYLYLRPGELRALMWSDIDLDARVVHITKAYDEEAKCIVPPKTKNGIRDVPIEPALVPLLERLKPKHAKDQGALVAPLLATVTEQRRAKRLRIHLAMAGVKRARLTEDTSTVLPINFRSCRDSGITWLALSGLGVDKILRRCGHDDISTTLGYVKLAEDLTGAAGVPFAPLPAELTGAKLGPSEEKRARKPVRSVPEEGVEPRQPVGIATDIAEATSTKPTRVDVSARPTVAAGPKDPLERALLLAARAERFDVVAQLARELESRRIVGTNVTPIRVRRGR